MPTNSRRGCSDRDPLADIPKGDTTGRNHRLHTVVNNAIHLEVTSEDSATFVDVFF
jgi:hypothetical protein